MSSPKNCNECSYLYIDDEAKNEKVKYQCSHPKGWFYEDTITICVNEGKRSVACPIMGNNVNMDISEMLNRVSE